jgi:hypothetical protein
VQARSGGSSLVQSDLASFWRAEGKAMLKIFWNRTAAKVKAQADWRHDPLGHPALRQMSLRELADLPMVAEMPMRMTRAEVTDDCRRGVSRVQSARCTVSR